MTIQKIISDAEMEILTGYKSPSKQCHSLQKAGIFFIVRRDGKPRTTWEHFNHLALTKPAQDRNRHEEPNFGALG